MTALVNNFLAGLGVPGEVLKHGKTEDNSLNVTLSEMQHALEAGSGGDKKRKGGGGKRAFDESKVKRDGSGQFSKIAGRRPDNDIRTPEQIDAEWKKSIGLGDNLEAAFKGAKIPQKARAKYKELEASHGVSLKKYETSLDKAPPKVLKLATEYMNYVASEMNKVLVKTPAAVSPSGTQAVRYRVTNPGTSKIDITPYFIKTKLKHSATDVLELVHAMGKAPTGFSWAQVLKMLDVDSDEELEHALEAGSAKRDAPKGDGKGGGRKFDESKVKRDGSGQFSRIAGRRPDNDIRTPEQIDASWKNGIEDDPKINQALLKDGYTKKIAAKMVEVAKATGVDATKIGKPKTPAEIKAADTVMKYVAQVANQTLSKSPAAVSPSGTQRVRLVVVNAGTPNITIKYTYVKNKMKHSIPLVDSFLDSLYESDTLEHALTLQQVLEMISKDVDEDED
jgi:hypothetical protein